MKNIAYVGALAGLLDIDADVLRVMLKEKYAKKAALLDSNQAALDLGRDYADDALRLPAADPARADGRDEGRDPDRRQHRGGARLPLRRRHRRRLVSDHAGDLVDGSVQGVLPEVSPRARDQPQPLRHPPGGGRDRGDRHGGRRVVGWRARLHADVGTGHLADERVPRAGVLRRGARRSSSTSSAPDPRPACRRARSRAT